MSLQQMKLSRSRGLVGLAAAMVALALVLVPASAASAGHRHHHHSTGHRHHHGTGHRHHHRIDLARARAATAAFHRTAAAARDGYGPFPPGVPLHECISALPEDGPHAGAMGVHWLKGANVDNPNTAAPLDDTVLDPANPEVLVYEPTRHGRLRLVALEYVVFEAAWNAQHPGTEPELFGRPMNHVPAGNRFELPPFYQIHAWVWKHNPAGMFADFNPRVTCEHAS